MIFCKDCGTQLWVRDIHGPWNLRTVEVDCPACNVTRELDRLPAIRAGRKRVA